MASICFLTPFVNGDTPVGGLKIMLQYANMLSRDEHIVYMVYPLLPDYEESYSFYRKLLAWKTFLHCKRKFVGSDQWFAKNKGVKEIRTLSLCFNHVPKADIYIASAVQTACHVAEYPTDRKYYFIQDFENWSYTSEYVLQTYRLPLRKIVISNWLKKRVNDINEKCALVPNGFDIEPFRMIKSFSSRLGTNICMLYHLNARKNCVLGFSALEIVRRQYPSLKVNIFGVYDAPEILPSWYHYTKQPSSQQLLDLYNDSAIFIGTSNVEGWGLTVGEAMLCGCAIACTDNDGYKEMVIDNQTGLLSPVGDAEALADNIIRLIQDDQLRERLSLNGNTLIKQFTVDKSYLRFKQAIDLM